MNTMSDSVAVAARVPRPRVPVRRRWPAQVFALGVLAALLYGWEQRDAYYLTARHGVGYALGIVGGSMMLLLLLYPLRKRLRFMGHWLQLRLWFRAHMVLGVIGPLCILYHCNFHLGAANSNVALACMALMVASGLVGRFIYVRIHHGLYGRKATLPELQNQLQRLEQQLFRAGGDNLGGAALAQLRRIEATALQRPEMPGNPWQVLSVNLRSRAAQRHLERALRRAPQPAAAERRQLRREVAAYAETLRKIAGFSFYERLFSIWHVLHVPIFFMLVVTGVLHVIAVHMY